MDGERGRVLADLVAQAEHRSFDMVTLRALVEEACDLGTERALKRLGLSDGDASRDISELRELLQAWRDAKKAARTAVIAWLIRALLAALLLGLAVRLGLGGMMTH